MSEGTEGQDRPIVVTPPSRGETAVRAVLHGLLSLVPAVGSAFATAFDDEWQRRQARPLEVADLIAADLGHAPGLAQRLVEDERLSAMFVSALEAAVRSGLEAKRRALARVVSRAVLDDALVDESELLLAALREIEAAHVRALERLARADAEAQRRLAEEEPHGGDTLANVSQWRDQVPRAARQEPYPVIMTLIRLGTLRTDSTFGDGGGLVPPSLTPFGRLLLDFIRSEPAEDPALPG